jgi:SAM-dependent methyltransferase
MDIRSLRHSIESILGGDVFKRNRKGSKASPGVNKILFQCPVCQRTVKRFIPITKGEKSWTQCPDCGALERHRALSVYLHGKPDVLSGARDILCIKCFDHPQPDCLFSDKAVAVKAMSSCESSEMTPLGLEYEDQSFDAVVALHALEDAPHGDALLPEIHRVLRPGGWALLQAEADLERVDTFEDPSLTDAHARTELTGRVDRIRVFGRNFSQVLRRAGFEVSEDFFIREMGGELAARYGLNLSEPIYVCRKAT